MLRELLKNEEITKIFLEKEEFWLKIFPLLSYVDFEICSDSFVTFKVNKSYNFKELLTTHKIITDFLEKNYDKFFDEYSKLITSEKFLTKTQSIKVLFFYNY
jgi:calcium binding protein 39